MKVQLFLVLACVVAFGAFALSRYPRANRLIGNETSALGSLRGVAAAQSAALAASSGPASSGAGGYVASLSALGGMLSPQDGAGIDPILAGGTKSGYAFAITSANAGGWTATAAPLEPGVTGDRYFGINMHGVLFVSSAGPVSFARDGSSSDPVFGQ